MPVDDAAAQRVSGAILACDDGIMAISLIDMQGKILASKYKQSFRETFGVSKDGEKYGGTLATATLSIVNELKNIVGEAQAIITIYVECKMMLIPMPLYQIPVGLVIENSVNAEDNDFVKKIAKLIETEYGVE